tara:strand:- start:238 stop:456 length:219 start_codon:yes stop_codon:yes gene_type:complete
MAKTGLLTDCKGSFASDNELPEYVAQPLDKIAISPIKITPIFLIFSPILEAIYNHNKLDDYRSTALVFWSIF